MKKLILGVAILISFSHQVVGQKITPYIKVGASTGNMQDVSQKIINALKSHSFTVLGSYHPSRKKALKVIAFTRSDLKNTVIRVKDRGALATAMKIGLVQKNGSITISYTNPEYMLRAYLRTNYNRYKSIFQKFSADLKSVLSEIGNDFTGFGGALSINELKKYHYKIMMPYFTDPIELNEFSSFEEGLKTIEKNLKARKNNTLKVYKIIYRSKKVAVFGIGLWDRNDGEAHFLPKIGESHVAALPYEIILQGKKASMLHGKYRIALFWPELSMGTFMRIMSTPGDIEDMLEGLCK